MAINPNYSYTQDDLMQPLFCTGCRQHIPKAISNVGNGLCPVCVANFNAMSAVKAAQQAALQQNSQRTLLKNNYTFVWIIASIFLISGIVFNLLPDFIYKLCGIALLFFSILSFLLCILGLFDIRAMDKITLELAKYGPSTLKCVLPSCAILYFEQQKRMVLLTRKPRHICIELSPDEMTEVELHNDSVTTTTSKKSGRVGSALLGGAILGPVGAIAGVSRSKTTSSTLETKITSGTIVVKTTSMQCPVITMTLPPITASEWAQRISLFADLT
jgi:hypothetical protein